MGVCEDVPSARRAVLPGSLGLFVRRRIVGTWPEVLDDMFKFYNYPTLIQIMAWHRTDPGKLTYVIIQLSNITLRGDIIGVPAHSEIKLSYQRN